MDYIILYFLRLSVWKRIYIYLSWDQIIILLRIWFYWRVIFALFILVIYIDKGVFFDSAAEEAVCITFFGKCEWLLFSGGFQRLFQWILKFDCRGCVPIALPWIVVVLIQDGAWNAVFLLLVLDDVDVVKLFWLLHFRDRFIIASSFKSRVIKWIRLQFSIRFINSFCLDWHFKFYRVLCTFNLISDLIDINFVLLTPEELVIQINL